MIDEQRTFEIYGYTSDDLAPHSDKPIVSVCEECGKYRDSTKHCYHELCRVCAQKKRWANPEARKKQSNAQKKRYEDLTERKIQSDTMKKRYEDPTERKKLSNAQKKRYEDPAERTKTSDSNKKRYEDPTERKKSSDAMKKRWANPEARKKQSDIQKKYFEDPKARERRSASLQGISYDEWVAFASEQKYCPKFNKSMKQHIRDKYNNCDYISGLPAYICNNNQNLDVHHIDYDKRQGCDDHEWRLIPLSHKNHARTNRNRPFWNMLFTYALQYDETYYNHQILFGSYSVFSLLQ